jgi:hypothetical protein
MTEAATGRFTVGVFQDAVWAGKGLEALQRAGFATESLTVLAREAPEIAALIQKIFGTAGDQLEIPGVGRVIARGPLVEALQGETRNLTMRGMAGTMNRVGFQPHDGRIFETLTGRGGVLVAVRGEPRAADALALLHSYGGGNAAIGAWTGRV